MQTESSITMVPAEPSMDPPLAMESKSMATSISSAVSIGVEDPPGITQRSFRPSSSPCA